MIFSLTKLFVFTGTDNYFFKNRKLSAIVVQQLPIIFVSKNRKLLDENNFPRFRRTLNNFIKRG